MDFDFEDMHPLVKIGIVAVLVIIIVGGIYVYKHKNTEKPQAPTGQYDYLFVSLPPYMSLQAGITVNPFIINSSQIRLPTDASLIYITGVHYVYSVGSDNKPVIFTSETIEAKYTGPNIATPIGVQYTAVGSNASAGMYSNYYNFFYINGAYIGTVAENGAPSIVTTSQLPAFLMSNFFNYGNAPTAAVTEINGTQVLQIINQGNVNGTPATMTWYFMPDRIVFEADFIMNNTTNEYTYYMQINANESQFMTVGLSG